MAGSARGSTRLLSLSVRVPALLGASFDYAIRLRFAPVRSYFCGLVRDLLRGGTVVASNRFFARFLDSPNTAIRRLRR